MPYGRKRLLERDAWPPQAFSEAPIGRKDVSEHALMMRLSDSVDEAEAAQHRGFPMSLRWGQDPGCTDPDEIDIESKYVMRQSFAYCCRIVHSTFATRKSKSSSSLADHLENTFKHISMFIVPFGRTRIICQRRYCSGGNSGQCYDCATEQHHTGLKYEHGANTRLKASV